ncbi:uncharacterized protein METZ01_LOCUS193453, partial [marine metagenome]
AVRSNVGAIRYRMMAPRPGWSIWGISRRTVPACRSFPVVRIRATSGCLWA